MREALGGVRHPLLSAALWRRDGEGVGGPQRTRRGREDRRGEAAHQFLAGRPGLVHSWCKCLAGAISTAQGLTAYPDGASFVRPAVSGSALLANSRR